LLRPGLQPAGLASLAQAA